MPQDEDADPNDPAANTTEAWALSWKTNGFSIKSCEEIRSQLGKI